MKTYKAKKGGTKFRVPPSALALALLWIFLLVAPATAAAAGDEADAYLTDDQAALLNEMLDTHLNYFLASGPITSHGLPLTAYKPGDPAAYIHSTPAEWGYALQAWIVAWERGKLTEGEAVQPDRHGIGYDQNAAKRSRQEPSGPLLLVLLAAL